MDRRTVEKKVSKRLARLHLKWPAQPNSIVLSLNRRSQNGFEPHLCKHLVDCFSNRRIPYLWKEHEFQLGELNKVFASQWISDDSVVMGTKCNKLIVLHVSSGRMKHIPMINGSVPYQRRHQEDEGSGIHAISINPGGSFLATGAENPNSLAVYTMPDFEPVCVGQGCHSDWIFDIKWLDDEFLVTGSRDGTIALWSIADALNCTEENGASGSSLKTIKPRCKCHSRSAEGHLHEDDHLMQKVRALEFNNSRKELASVVVSSGCVTFWDVRQFREVSCRKLHYNRESVCMAFSDSYSLYAVGSQNHVTLIDTRKGRTVAAFPTGESCSGVRSLKFQGDILSAGTGKGAIKFIDIRQSKYLVRGDKPNLSIQVGKGWLSRDFIYHSYFTDAIYHNAIYTHCYDDSGMRLFAAGGPLPSGLTGNYSGLFH